MELVDSGRNDLDIYIDLWFSLAKEMENYSDLNNLIYENKADVSEDGFIRQFEDEDSTWYLIKKEGEVIGFTTLERGEHPSREYSQYTRIVNLFIRENYRGRGYGSKAIEEIKEIARNQGSDHMKVSSEWENSGARSFYRENGFEEKKVDFAQKLE